MADEDLYESKGESTEENKKRSSLRGLFTMSAGFFVTALKILVLILVLVIMIFGVIVFVLNFLDSRNLSNTFSQGQVVEFVGKPPILSWYSGIPTIRGNTTDYPPQLYVVEIRLGYIDNVALNTELIKRKEQIQDIVRSYFSSRSTSSLREELKVKADLRNRINFILINGQISEVIFTSYSIYEP